MLTALAAMWSVSVCLQVLPLQLAWWWLHKVVAVVAMVL
jgi:hypothetical protein